MHYENKHDDLILSDIDEMRKLASPQDKPSIYLLSLHLFETFVLKIIHTMYIIFRWKEQSVDHGNVLEV